MKILGVIALCLVNFSLNANEVKAKRENANVYHLLVTEKGFEPAILKVKAQTPSTLKITRKTNATCAREITIPSQKIKVDLPLDKEVTVQVGKLAKGEVKFGCAMNLMIGGVMNVE